MSARLALEVFLGDSEVLLHVLRELLSELRPSGFDRVAMSVRELSDVLGELMRPLIRLCRTTLSGNHLDVLSILSDLLHLLLQSSFLLFDDYFVVFLNSMLLLHDLVVSHFSPCSLTLLNVLQVFVEHLSLVVATRLLLVEDTLTGPESDALLRNELLQRLGSNELVAVQVLDNVHLVLYLLILQS